MKARFVPYLMILGFLASCGTPASSPASQTPSPTVTPPPAAYEPNPLNVKVVADDNLAVTGVISNSGGSLTAQAADGSIFTLTFPEGALQSDEIITLTPLSSIEGLLFSGGLVGGVQMSPEGLRLFQPATLTIESPKTVAADGYETVAFGYHADGEGVYLNPSTVSGSLLTLEIWHFSGAAAAQATPGEIQTQQQQFVPSNAEDAFTQGVQEWLGIERQAQMFGEPDPEGGVRMIEFLREAYESFIAPQLPIALEDCEKAPAIISKALGWARQATLMTGEDEFRTEIAKIIETYELVKEKCIQNYTGEGSYHISSEQSGLQLANGYEFQITFRVNADGSISGEGVNQKVEALSGSEFFQCIDADVNALVFPPMKVIGTVIKDATGQSPDKFQLTIVGEPSTNTSQFICTEFFAGVTWPLDAVPDQGFILYDIEITATDGAEANGEESNSMLGTTTVTIWDLQIHRQETP